MALVAGLLALPALAVPAAAAAPTGVDLTCPGTATGTADPGLSLLPTPQHVHGVLRGGTDFSSATQCTSLSGVRYRGATIELDGSGDFGCLAGMVSGTGKITWDTGETSTLVWSLTLIFLVPIGDAHITGGPLAGSSLLAIGIPTGFTGTCATSPLTSITGIGAAFIIRS